METGGLTGAALFAAFFGLLFAIHGLSLLMGARYYLGEFLLLILATGLVMGLTAKFLPQGCPVWTAMLISFSVGAAVFWGGAWELRVVRALGIEGSRRRCFHLLLGLLLVPTAVAGVVAFVAFVMLLPQRAVTPLGRIFLGLALCLLTAGLSFLLLRRYSRMRARVRDREGFTHSFRQGAKRENPEETADAAAEEKLPEKPPGPPEPPDPEA